MAPISFAGPATASGGVAAALACADVSSWRSARRALRGRAVGSPDGAGATACDAAGAALGATGGGGLAVASTGAIGSGELAALGLDVRTGLPMMNATAMMTAPASAVAATRRTMPG
ncbi:MAG TPA: hypothetical protein VE987_03250, partial [Polyangiaceae bacterium]|nr:hypothetical protein [Polyangiaceae bacterium]